MNTPSTRTTTLAFGLALAFAAAPGIAHADTYCVHGPCGEGSESFVTLKQAVDKAAINSGPDRIVLGEGSVTTTNVVIEPGNPVTLVGAPSGLSRLIGAPGLDKPVLRIQNSASSVSGLKIRLGAGSVGSALTLEEGSASGLNIEDAPEEAPTTSGSGVLMFPGTTLKDSRVVLAGASKLPAVAASSDAGSSTLIENSTISGFTGLTAYGSGLVDARRLKILDSGVGVAVRNNGGTLRLTNSLVEATRLLGSVALSSGSETKNAHSRLEGWGVTAVGADNDAVGASSEAMGEGVTSEVELSGSTFSGFATSLRRKQGPNATATLTVASSNYETAAAQEQGPGAITGASNIDVDPGFVNSAAGDYRLAGGSPLIDAGGSDPFGTTDLAGAARFVDGNADGTPRADIGAYEYQPQPAAAPPVNGVSGGKVIAQEQPVRDTVAPAVSGFALSRKSVRRGSKGKVTARFRLSEAATVRLSVERRSGRGRKARTVTIGSLGRKAVKGANSVVLTGKLRPGRLAPGTYRLVITARDAAGNSSAARRITFRVTRKR